WPRKLSRQWRICIILTPRSAIRGSRSRSQKSRRLKPRIAIPVPHSQKPEYAQRSLPQYVTAIEKAGGEAVVIQLDQTSHQIAKQITDCQAVLLPGSAADVDPQKYGASRHAKTADADPLRDVADELLLQDAHNLRKPILA